MKEKAKNYIVKEEYYRYKNSTKNYRRSDNNITNNTLDKFVKLVLDYKNFEKEKKE